jgi:hypothetical protein
MTPTNVKHWPWEPRTVSAYLPYLYLWRARLLLCPPWVAPPAGAQPLTRNLKDALGVIGRLCRGDGRNATWTPHANNATAPFVIHPR